ncbi:MAG: hypothetical protein ACRC92_27095 [Peptostreptococcaceae bacterium]
MVGNNASGKDRAAAIVESSLYMKYLFKPGTGSTLRPITGELMDMSKENQMAMTLPDTSQFVIIPLTVPEIYLRSGDTNTRLMMKGYMKLICDTATSIELFEDEQLEVVEPTFKNSAINIPMLTNQTGVPKRVRLAIPTDYSGYFITQTTRHWMSQISDPHSRTAPYNGLAIDFNNYSHTAAIAFFKPNKTLTRTDFGAVILMMAPVQAPTSVFNADAASPGVPSFTLEFTATVLDTNNIRVKELIESIRIKYRDYIVMDHTLVGIANGTELKMVEQHNADAVFKEYTTVD